MSKKIVLALVLNALATPALAGAKFAYYEGKDSVAEGNGGTKEVSNGIDFWVSGSPPRRFQIIGTITDRRQDKLLSGRAVGSKKIAKLAIEQGGNAVILLDQNSKYAGSLGSANVFGGDSSASIFTQGRAVHNVTTTFVVIKYLEQQ